MKKTYIKPMCESFNILSQTILTGSTSVPTVDEPNYWVDDPFDVGSKKFWGDVID